MNENTNSQQANTQQYEENVSIRHHRYFNKRSVIFVLLFLIIFSLIFIHYFSAFIHEREMTPASKRSPLPFSKVTEAPARPSLAPLPERKVLANSYHIFQSFNNCGPAALSMTLSYFGITASQAELGQALRPYQVPGGDNDDKSVTLEEIASYSQSTYGLMSYRRPMGDDQLIKQFIAADIPVIVRTWLERDDDIGHYRIIKGYDETKGIFIQDDSYQGKNLEYTYENFNEIWKKFNYEYLVIFPKDREAAVKVILGDDLDERKAWSRSVQQSQKDLAANPNDAYAGFNLSVAYYEVGDYQKSVEEFEKVQNRLSFRTLWYQIEPFKAYYEIKDYDKLLNLSQKVLHNQNKAYSELYIIRGDVYKDQNNIPLARAEYEKAVLYNANLTLAQDRLNSL